MAKVETNITAEQAELEAGVASIEVVSTTSNEESFQDESGQDLSDMIADDFGEDPETGEQLVDTTVEPLETTEPLTAAAQTKVVTPASTAEPTATPSSNQEETQTPSLESATREDLLERLLKANEDMAKFRAEQAETPSTAEGQEKDTPAQSPAEIRTAAETLLTTEYALSEEQADAYLVSPETVLPAYAARLHLNIMTSVAQMMRAHVPTMIQNTLSQTTESDSWDNQFYDKWKGLTVHKEEVMKVRRSLKNLYPDASEQELDQNTGSFMSVKYGIVPEAVTATGTTAIKPKVVPHRPIARGGTQATATPAAADNFFTDLAEEDVAENF